VCIRISAAAGAHSVQGLLTTVCESATLHEGHFSDEQKAIECGETLDDQEYCTGERASSSSSLQLFIAI
jgi:ubiquitin C-terminal hydrolase